MALATHNETLGQSSETRSDPPPASLPEKPLLRGVSHEISFFIALVATAVLVWTERARTDHAIASVVFGGAMATLFGVSALYHRVNWSKPARARMRRMDHAAIFVLIAGGYTPLFSLVPSQAGGHGALVVVWSLCAIGVTKSLFWAHAPKWLTAALCVGIGWVAIGQVIDRVPIVGARCAWVLAISGAIYSVGALTYALKRPNPWPKTFGYHEVFHALVIVASVCLFAHVMMVLRAV